MTRARRHHHGFKVGDVVENVYSQAHGLKDYGTIFKLGQISVAVRYPDGSDGAHLYGEIRKVSPLEQLADAARMEE